MSSAVRCALHSSTYHEKRFTRGHNRQTQSKLSNKKQNIILVQT